jgi:hypothetical protein
MGGFWSPDTSGAASLKNPRSWNRYGYAGGDPVNFRDPSGQIYEPTATDCINDPEFCEEWDRIDARMAGDCEPQGAYFFDDFFDSSWFSSTGVGCVVDNSGGGGGGAAVALPCWSQVSRIGATLTELAENVEEVAAKKITNAGELAALGTDISGDVSAEMAQISVMLEAGGPPSGPDFVGGHFNLIIPTSQLTSAFSAADFAVFSGLLGGYIDGTRQPALYGNAAQGDYTLHSKQHGRGNSGYFNAHFDIFNWKTDVVGAIGHLFGDVFAGHMGSPCLDPAWN